MRPTSGPPAIAIASLGAGLIVLNHGSPGTPVPSDAITFSSGAPSELIVTDAAATVGKLPGWVAGTGIPILELHCDAYAERAKRDPGDPEFDDAIDGWTDLRDSGASDLTQATTARQPQLTATGAVAPTIAFDDHMFERADAVDIVQDDCCFGVVFSSVGNITGVRHLIGRWSGGNEAFWQWRLVYERVAGSPDIHKVRAEFISSGGTPTIHSLEAVIDEPTEKTSLVYRVSDPGTPTGELWVNGVLVATTTSLLSATNTSATQILTVGARYASLPSPGIGSLADQHHGSIDQCFYYSETVSDAALSAIHHELARRAGIKLGPVPQSNLTQPYTDANPEPRRRLDRWPVAMINLFGGSFYDDNVLSQNTNWRRDDEDAEKVVDWFRNEILEILSACPDFEIMINRPQGNYRNDIISAGIFGNTDTGPTEPIIQEFQWEALSGWTVGMTEYPGVFGEFALSDHNTRDGRQSGDAPFARRCWFYTGNPTINDNGEVTQNARVGARNLAPCSASFYQENFLDDWAVKDDRFRCFFVDSASKWDRKWVEIVQDPDVNESFTLVGEAIATDPNSRKGAVWFALVGIGTAPWWVNNSKAQGYNWAWSAGAWEQTPIYVGIGRTNDGVVINPNNPQGENEADSLSFEDAYRLIDKGATPVAWGGDYRKIGAAWYYGGRRIPVGRYPMMSPRISRVWR